MSAFEFFFSFYGLLLGFSVAELVGGFARLIHERRAVVFGLLTPLLGVVLAIDIASFWVQAWLIFRGAPFNYALLILGLVVASLFYVAATLVVPRDLAQWPSLDEHFWAHRRWVLLCAFGANIGMFAAMLLFASRSGELARIFDLASYLQIGFFMTATLAAAIVRQRWLVLTLLVLLVAYQAWGVVRHSIALMNAEPWLLLGPVAG
jgi:hypothetical protein